MKNHLAVARKLAKLLDAQFGVGKFKFGLDPILGLLPGGGDAIGLILSSYIVWIGIKMELPKLEVAKMMANIGIDFLIGSVPLVGDLFDAAYKANIKNIQILNKYS